MKRDRTGRYETIAAGGETVPAFIPDPLPPTPPVEMDGALAEALEAAGLALGRLDGASHLHRAFFLYSYVRKEAVLSSQIEGTQSSLSELLRYEAGEGTGSARADVEEISRHVRASDHSLRRLREDGFPLSNRLIREAHGVLLAEGRGSRQDPGAFRRSQNWIGGDRPGNARFVPPPHHRVPDLMAGLERFLHADGDGIPAIVRAGLAHAHFETIHPFLDGNGRVGRLLITLSLLSAGVLREPLLYLSLRFKQRRSTY